MNKIARYPKHLLRTSTFLLMAFLTVGMAQATNDRNLESMIDEVISTARTYMGTPHRMGGLTNRGIDCSGLIVKSFESVGMTLPRTSSQQAQLGEKVRQNQLNRGDLVFFKIGTKISHVGLVTGTRGGATQFIHTSSSRGVMQSSLGESYWSQRFTFGRRVWEDQSIVRRPVRIPTVAAVVPGSYPEASIRKLKRREIKRLGQREAELMQAEIWARNGYRFKDRGLQQYFERQGWYQNMDTSRRKGKARRSMTKVEKKNLKRLRNLFDLKKID